MEKIKRTIDDIFNMSDSRYSLVNAISRKAREIADEAENNNDVLYRKPVNMVIDRLLDGRATIEHIEEIEADNLFDDDARPAHSVETAMPVYAEHAEAEDNGEDENGDFDPDDDGENDENDENDENESEE